MAQALHKTDEESDRGAYAAYLRAQSDADLLDILRHLDPDRYPARLDAAGREARRRHMLHVPVYTQEEAAIRGVALAALALAAVTFVLSAVLTAADALGPSWPTEDMLPEGILVTQVMRLFGVALLRGLVVWSVHLGLYPLGLLTLGWWIVSRAPRVRRRRARADVWRLACLGFGVLCAAVAVAGASYSAVPLLFHRTADAWPWPERAVPLLNPLTQPFRADLTGPGA